jgi:hypothetical protein
MKSYKSQEVIKRSEEKTYQLCKYNCGNPIEDSKMSSHLHVCPNRPEFNAILDMIRAPDPNEVYIPSGLWPSSYPKTKEVYDCILRIGHKPPFDLVQEHEWVDVRPRSKKTKEIEPKFKKFNKK